MKSGGHGGHKSIRVINQTRHGLSPSDLAAFREKAPDRADTMIVKETAHRGTEHHALELWFLTRTTKALYCKVAGGNFSDVLEQLKNCKQDSN